MNRKALEQKMGWLQNQLENLDPTDTLTRQKFTSSLIQYQTKYLAMRRKSGRKSKYQTSVNDLKTAFMKGFTT